MQHRIILVSALLGLSALSIEAQTQPSIYTGVSEKECRKLKSASDDYLGRCRGVGGYSLLVVEGDLRQNVTVITPAGSKHSLELWTVVSSAFSMLGPKAEWRVTKQNGKTVPSALILRYNANEDPEKPGKKTSYLVVTKITSTEICVTDKVAPGPKANEEARQLADEAGSKRCLKSP